MAARESLPALITALDDDDAKVREGPPRPLVTWGRTRYRLAGCSRISTSTSGEMPWAIGKPAAGKPVLDDLCAGLKNSDPRTASGAAQALGNIGADAAEAVPALAEAMRGTNIVLCRLAAKALSQIGTPALSTLITHLQHTDPFVRGESAMAIGWMGPAARSAVPVLTQVLRGPRAAVSRTPPPPPLSSKKQLECGVWQGDSETITPTQTPAPDSATTEDSCRSCRQALGRIGSSAAPALPDLHEAVRTGTESLRQFAQQAVRLIQGA